MSESDGVTKFEMGGLWAALARLDRMLERATTAADAAYSSGAQAEPYRGLYISSEEVSRLLKREPGTHFLAGQDKTSAEAMPPGSRFPWLQQTFDLSAFDVDVMLVALAPEVDLRYERLYAYLQDDVTRRRPTVDLALNLLCATREAKIDARARFTPDAPLLRHKILHLVADGGGPQFGLLGQYLKLDESIVRFLLGQECMDSRLVAFARLDAVPEIEWTGSQSDDWMRRGIEARKAGTPLHLYFEGPANGTKRAAGLRLAAAMKARLLLSARLSEAAMQPDFEAAIAVLFREAQLLQAALWLEDLDAMAREDRSLQAQALRARLESAPGLVMLEGTRALDPRFQTVGSIPFPELGFHERRAVWAAELGEQQVAQPDGSLDELASRYRISADQIRRAVRIAVNQAKLESRAPQTADFMRTARAQSQRDLGSLARKLTPVNTWKDLVLPPDQIAQLHEICNQARYRHVVFGDWGFDRKLSLGKGLSALFSGPPGTGKTMAAEVIANDLGLDLYKIDLSQVVSKYIGETEKNLDRLFREARAGNAILFFDECDALFGKRTAVQDAHDRYANIEIAYLLQKMDEHDGLSVLATNLKQNLDVAFVRRLTFIVEFPFPDETSRLRIWQNIWPEEVPRSADLDLEFMATQFKVPGGAVKNIALGAAFLAVGKPQPEVSTEDLLLATRRELEKAGRTVPRSEFGVYGDRIQELMAQGAGK